MRTLGLVILLIGLLLPTMVYAAEPNVKIGGELFLHYRYNISGFADEDPRAAENDANSFDIDRARLNLLANMDREFWVRLAIDGQRESETSALGNQIRYAYFAWAPHRLLTLKAGQFEEPWYNLTANRFRFRALQTAMNTRYTHVDSAELGVSLSGTFPRNFGGYAAYVGNGQGGESAEINRGKAGGAVLMLTPLQGVRWLRDFGLAGTFRYDKGETIPGPEMDQRMVYGGMAFWRVKRFNAGFEYLRTRYDFHEDFDPLEAQGLHAFADFSLPRGLGIFARWMLWNPSLDDDEETPSPYSSHTGSGNTLAADEDGLNWLIAGAFYQANQFLRLFGYYQREWYEEEDEDGDPIDPEQIVGAAVDVSF